MRIFVAIRAFFAAIFSRDAAEGIAVVLAGKPPETEAESKPLPAPRPEPAKPIKPSRSDAVTLLATLQREARFVDIVKEPLSEYSDAQIGAAARDVLRDCGTVLDRLFGIEPLVEEEDGAQIETPAKFDAGRYRLTGNVAGEGPFTGTLVHHGWEAKHCELPKWSGSEDATLVVAPVELEIK